MRLSNILRFHTLDKANAPAFKPKQLYQLLNKFVTSIDTPLQKIIVVACWIEQRKSALAPSVRPAQTYQESAVRTRHRDRNHIEKGHSV